MAKIPKLPKGHKAWAKEDSTPAALRGNRTSVEGGTIPPEVFLSEDRVGYWQRQASWTVEEAALLWCGLDPLMLRAWAASLGRSLSDVCPVEVVPRVHALRAAVAIGDLGAATRPQAILQWLEKSGARLPPLMRRLAATLDDNERLADMGAMATSGAQAATAVAAIQSQERLLTVEQEAEVIRRFKGGESVNGMKADFGVSNRTLDRVLIRAGLKANKAK